MEKVTKSPTFIAISPASIGLDGGEFTITGDNLRGTNEVVFKNKARSVCGVTKLTVTDTAITGILASLPGTEEGDVLDVTVYIKGIPIATTLTLTVKSPLLTKITPADGLINANTKITLSGLYLNGASEVLIAGIQAKNIKIIDDSCITAVVPEGIKAGAAEVTVSVQGITSNSISFTYQLKKTIPLTIDTTCAGLPSDMPVYIYIVGEVKTSKTEKNFYYINQNHKPTLMLTTDNTNPKSTFPDSDTLTEAAVTALQKNYKINWADYSIPVSSNNKTCINLAEINSSNIASLGTGTKAFSGRIYISVGVPRLPFTVNSDGYAAPVFYDGSGEFTLFDWIEFSYDSLQNFNANTTMVDQFGLSLTLSATSNNLKDKSIKQVGLKKGFSRNDMMEVQTALYPEGIITAPFLTTEKPPSGKRNVYPESINSNVGGILRVCSPSTIAAHSSLNPGIKGYFDATIDQWYDTWKHTPLIVSTSKTEVFSAMSDSLGVLHFKVGQLTTLSQWNDTSATAFIFNKKITTRDIWQCNGMLATGNNASKNVGKIIAAAFNRGVISNHLSDVNGSAQADDFYPLNVLWSHWAELAHQNSLHNLAYAFAYDDVCQQNSTIALAQPDSIKITLEAF